MRSNKCSFIYSSSGEECASGIQSGSTSNVTGESNSKINLCSIFLISLLQLSLTIHASCSLRIPKLLCAALTLR